jgi:hypothetical protein
MSVALTYSSPLDALDDAVTALQRESLDNLSDDTFGSDLVGLQRQIDRLEAERCRRLLRFDKQRGWASQALSAVSWLRRKCGLSASTASQRLKMARVLPELPTPEKALAAGDIGFQQASVIARSAEDMGLEITQTAEPILIEAAQSGMDPTQLRWITRRLHHCIDPDGALDEANRDHERRYLHLSQSYENVWFIDGRLDPEGGAALKTALDALTPPIAGDTRSGSERMADALVELSMRQLQSDTLPDVAGQRPHLSVIVSAETLRRDRGTPSADLEWSGPVVAELSRRLACDATKTVITVDPTGIPIDVGRATRVISPALRRALVLRDRGCAFPDCDRPPAWCDGHHIKHWADGGATDLNNLVLLCRPHHRVVHEGGWPIALEVVTPTSSSHDP